MTLDPPYSDRRGAPLIGVVGPGEASATECALAEEVGRLLALRGAVVLCGGLGGVMEAAARGASGQGGLVVGVLPGYDRESGNAFLTVALATGMGQLRNGLLVNMCDAFVAVGGSWGTVSEVALAMRSGKRVAALGPSAVPLPRGDDPCRQPLRAATAGEAVDAVLTG